MKVTPSDPDPKVAPGELGTIEASKPSLLADLQPSEIKDNVLSHGNERFLTSVDHFLNFLEAVARGRACPEESLPAKAVRPRPSADEESVIDLMHALIRRVSERSGVAAPLIATHDDLHDFFLGDPSARLASGWRRELVGELLTKLLAGELGLTVKQGRIELL